MLTDVHVVCWEYRFYGLSNSLLISHLNFWGKHLFRTKMDLIARELQPPLALACQPQPVSQPGLLEFMKLLLWGKPVQISRCYSRWVSIIHGGPYETCEETQIIYSETWELGTPKGLRQEVHGPWRSA